ncbi:hypothetical protein B0T24DRAFT_685129 [Lasiosphaeria ovina]|uniref:Uncharacterized protein n=1 Tax=Lasiosphaeria ovina TaxID=92902 RepID=A0AAE0JSG4_9PEZI|nr:hypothetical protein B0T24DRAFT_685129 [Lasiosphaeria ovina]
MATLHSCLASEFDVQDYHFLVDPIDHHHITCDGFPQRDHLNEAFPGSKIDIHFNPTTGEMSVSTLGAALQVELMYLLLGKFRVVIAAHPQIADTEVIPFLPTGDTIAAKVPHPLVSLYQSARDVTPSIVINTSIFAGNRGNKGGKNTMSKSAPAHVMTRYPGLQTMVRLDLGGLTVECVDREHLERRVQRIADLSSVLTWTRDEHGNIIGTSESLSKEDGELRLRLSGNGSNVPGQGVEVAVKYSEILDAIRLGGKAGRLGGVPQDNNSITLQSSVVPFPSFRRHIFASHFNANIVGRAGRLLSLGGTATAATTVLGGARMFRPLPHATNRARAVVSPWSRILARLPRKL